jgi:hypothetical protein
VPTRETPSVCAAVTCPAGTRCIPAPKACITTPCPQHDCVAP